MYFITKKDSATGQKFAAVGAKIDEAHEAEKAIAKELGAKEWRAAYWSVVGGFSSLFLKETPDLKHWKNVNDSKDEWMPRLNTKEGKQMQARFDAMPTVSANDLNSCVGFNGAPFKNIGFARNHDEYFGFIVGDDWKFKKPDDCEEVTRTGYKSLFETEEKTQPA